MKGVYLMDNKNKILAIQNISEKNKKFDLSYYIFKRIEENDFKRTSSPMRIGIKITNNCLFRCEYCFTEKNKKRRNRCERKVFKKEYDRKGNRYNL